jgi:hypothetical protein
VRRIRNFFLSLQSESKRIWILFASYSHVSIYSQTPFIPLQNIRFCDLVSVGSLIFVEVTSSREKIGALKKSPL